MSYLYKQSHALKTELHLHQSVLLSQPGFHWRRGNRAVSTGAAHFKQLSVGIEELQRHR